MGCTFSRRGPAVQEQKKVNKQIDREIAKDAAKDGRIIKLLLLGTGDSGKSTIMKQVKILHKEGFTEDEINSGRTLIMQNIFSSMRTLIDQLPHFNLIYMQNESESHAQLVHDITDNIHTMITNTFHPSEAQVLALRQLWQEDAIQDCFERRDRFQLQESVQYYFEHLNRIMSSGYTPTTQDILRIRVATTGIIEACFQVKRDKMSLNFKLIDVGGQRSERRKWIHCFENVHAILFVVAISEYNQVLLEDGKTNRMSESLRLFESIVNNAFFVEASFILFLNKVDLFEVKITRFPLQDYIQGYDDSGESPKEFVASKYLSKSKRKDKIFHHFTCATDTKQIQHLFDDVVNIIIRVALEKVNMC
ncbi:hypothetical protein TCAL_00539 [Tigriopus californicus]|uniref:Uncharacterized protein n=1 Tax=Tigriopus californicus TaxID=6832 RepID=A0A553PAZ6_TIGCA|nr:guanine nucleotide-binding protein subunit alpha-11-like [Tigriopus californicus]TRY74847.1 hypothetical protein TCAL_00539 [Tigriopus californicus]|eukprot:TCALIF_00539-PA protein Name:"Similar to Galphao G protein alpha o subunit (Drosophila melanogaster)" AED:0.00 eAED:0.00 QI:0/-1/0/1/-1/1/1/0/362